MTRLFLVTTKESTRKRQVVKIKFYESIHVERQSFKNLQNVFRESIFLTHYNRRRRLFVNLDSSKSWEFVDMIYHVESDSNSKNEFSRIKMQFIMFLNRCLNETKKNYWFTKLEIVDIVWVIKKIRHMIKFNECSSIIIYIDHFVAIFISRQINLTTSSIDKLNLRLIRAS